MSYDIRKTQNDELITVPLELPMYEGTTPELGRQAEVCLASVLRHAAVCDWIRDNLDIQDPDTQEAYAQEWAAMSSQLTGLFVSLTGIAENMQVDIMQEIWEMPWQV